jgi:fermentation-respiration switch protein FrsA (DUF1100 family)
MSEVTGDDTAGYRVRCGRRHLARLVLCGRGNPRARCGRGHGPGTYLPYISPTPFLLLVAEGDHLVPSELAIAAFDTAHQPKELVILPGGHFDAYTKGFDASSGQARDWFTRHLAA